MKRLLILLLCMLLLTACAQQPAHPDSDNTPHGFRVTTDYSAYTPFSELGAQYTRLTDAPMPCLLARTDYGQLYPYVGSTMRHVTEDGYAYAAGSSYGMVDSSGRIVTDAVYCEISPVCDETGIRLPLWQLAQVVSDNAANLYGTERYALASLDGSFVTDCIYTRIIACDDRVLAIQDAPDCWRFDLFAPDGTLLLSSEMLACRTQLSAHYPSVSYGEELLVLAFDNTNATEASGGTWLIDETGAAISLSETVSYYYVDLDGNPVLGPYPEAEAFSCGLALVQCEDQLYAFIDHDGNIVAGGYRYATGFLNGTATVIDAETDCHQIIDTTGQVLLESEDVLYVERNDMTRPAYQGGNPSRALPGFLFCADDSIAYYDADCKPLYGASLDSKYLRLTYGGIFLDRTSEDCVLYDARDDTTHTLSIPDYLFTYPLDGMTCFLICCCDSNGQDSFLVMDESLTEQISGTGSFGTLCSTDCTVLIFYHDAPGHVTFYDTALNPILTIPTTALSSLAYYGDRICCTDAFSCRYYALDGTLLFRYPLLSAVDD